MCVGGKEDIIEEERREIDRVQMRTEKEGWKRDFKNEIKLEKK